MKTVADIRRENLKLAIRELGTAAAVAETTGTSQQYISQILNCTLDIKTGQPRAMGSKLARRVEAALSKPQGWMDQDHVGIDAAVATPKSADSVTEVGPLSAREIDAVLALRALSQRRRKEFVDALMAAAEEALQFSAEVLARQGVTSTSGKRPAGASLPVRPDGEQADTVPGRLDEART